MHWQRGFLEAQLGIGRDSSSLPQSAAEHVLVAAVQMRPVVSASQSLSPHTQSDGLGAEPSVVAHAAGREQVLAAAVQTRPVPCPSPLLVHAAFPQMQGVTLLGAEPSVVLQAEAVTPEEA